MSASCKNASSAGIWVVVVGLTLLCALNKTKSRCICFIHFRYLFICFHLLYHILFVFLSVYALRFFFAPILGPFDVIIPQHYATVAFHVLTFLFYILKRMLFCNNKKQHLWCCSVFIFFLPGCIFAIDQHFQTFSVEWLSTRKLFTQHEYAPAWWNLFDSKHSEVQGHGIFKILRYFKLYDVFFLAFF